MTLRTVPFKIIPGFRSFISITSLRRIGAGMLSLGSLEGFSSSFKISVRVISPIPSSLARRVLSLIFLSRLPDKAASLSCAFVPSLEAALFSSGSKAMVMPPIAAARAFPMAVFVLRITTFCLPPLCSLRSGAFWAGFSAAFVFAASFCAFFTSSMVSPSFSRSFPAAS